MSRKSSLKLLVLVVSMIFVTGPALQAQPIDAEVQVNITAPDSQDRPEIVALTSGEFFVAYRTALALFVEYGLTAGALDQIEDPAAPPRHDDRLGPPLHGDARPPLRRLDGQQRPVQLGRHTLAHVLDTKPNGDVPDIPLDIVHRLR